MPARDIIVVGASAGGVEALREMTRALPPNLAAALFVVLHVAPDSPSVLPGILARHGSLPTRNPRDLESIRPRCIYVAPPGHHLLLEHGYIRLTVGPKEHGHRPAVDPLFRSAAAAYGPRVIGVILSGGLDDGTAGLLAIKQQGGLAIVQEPSTALAAGMPRSALARADVDYVESPARIASILVELAGTTAEGAACISDEMEMSRMSDAGFAGDEGPGTPSGHSCPDCNGILFEMHDGDLVRFRCRVGHAYSLQALAAGQHGAVEDALWVAFRTLKERAALLRRLASEAEEGEWMRSAERFKQSVEDADDQALVIQDVLASRDDQPRPDGERTEIEVRELAGSDPQDAGREGHDET